MLALFDAWADLLMTKLYGLETLFYGTAVGYLTCGGVSGALPRSMESVE